MQNGRGTFENFRKSIQPEWIEQALKATGTATIRRRRLPAEQVIWLVLGMALFRNLAITEVVKRLDLALPGKTDPARASVAQARRRVGPAPLKWLFELCARKWAHASARTLSWRGLSLYGVDGTTVRVPDSLANHRHFGRPNSGRGEGGYPMLRLVTLMALRSHLLLAARFGPYGMGEQRLADDLWPELPEHSLVLFDRGFWAARTLLAISSGTARYWLTRERKNLQRTVLRRLGPGDELVEFEVPAQIREQDPALPEHFQARALVYQRPGYQPQMLLTSLLDPKVFPAREVVALYHERWELELGFDEVKTELLEREEAIRSQTPDAIEQELWGIALAYNLIRQEMSHAAKLAGLPPSRLSFVAGLHFIREELVLCSLLDSVATIPKHLDRLRRNLSHMILPPRRPLRSFPRAVKIKITNYPRKPVAHA